MNVTKWKKMVLWLVIILSGKFFNCFITYLYIYIAGLQQLSDIETGVKHILADIVHKHQDSMEFIRGW